jgi:hypothetical protein
VANDTSVVTLLISRLVGITQFFLKVLDKSSVCMRGFIELRVCACIGMSRSLLGFAKKKDDEVEALVFHLKFIV